MVEDANEPPSPYVNGVNGAVLTAVPPALTHNQENVLGILKKHCDKYGRTVITGKQIADEAKINRTGIYPVLNELERAGLLIGRERGVYRIAL